MPGCSLGTDIGQLIVNKMELKGVVRCTGVVPYGLYSYIGRELCVTKAYVRKIYCSSDSLSPMKRGPIKGLRCKITEEDRKYIKMLVSSDPTIYQSVRTCLLKILIVLMT